MSMNAEPEDFDQLRRLLKLKRHELPPPRYFNDFSGHVLARIRTGTAGGRFESLEAKVSQLPWAQQLWRMIEHRPAVSGILTTAVCGLLVIGVFASDNTRPTLNITTDGMARIESPEARPSETGRFVVANPGPAGGLFANSTNPAAQLRPSRSLFDEFPNLGSPQRVNGMPMPPR